MKKMKKIAVLIIGILLLNSLVINCYAATKVTKENLDEALQKFVTSDENDEDYEIEVSDDEITVTVDEEDYTIKYDLTDEPKFYYEIPVKKGMTYDDFKAHTDNLMLPMLGYIAVANIQGAEIEDASSYILMAFLMNAFNGSASSANSYVIVDDTDLEDGVTIDKDNSDSKTIYASEFGDKVMEYVNAVYKDKQVFSDATDGINSFEWVTERKDVTDDSCNLVSTLTVKTSADFSKMKEYASNSAISGSTSTSQEPQEEQQQQQVQQQEQQQQQQNTGNPQESEEVKDNSNIKENVLPATGAFNIAIILVIACALLIIFGIKLMQYKDIK